MANADKNIVITPNVGSSSSQPTIVFTGQNAVPITLRVTDDGTLSWEGTVGQLFSISNIVSGTLFTVNDASGNPLLEIKDTPEIVTYAPITGAAGSTILDDISSQFDGANQVFALRQNGNSISSSSIADSKDIQLEIDGRRLNPYLAENNYVFFPVYDAWKGFRVRENRLIIYNAPDVGNVSSLILRRASSTRQIRRYPMSASSIGLGD
jgi:hypothetical protein